jgi:hypothetical protein
LGALAPSTKAITAKTATAITTTAKTVAVKPKVPQRRTVASKWLWDWLEPLRHCCNGLRNRLALQTSAARAAQGTPQQTYPQLHRLKAPLLLLLLLRIIPVKKWVAVLQGVLLVLWQQQQQEHHVRVRLQDPRGPQAQAIIEV